MKPEHWQMDASPYRSQSEETGLRLHDVGSQVEHLLR
jgi:hypothetical protein